MNEINIIQHNVLCWTKQRANELSNIYIKTNPDIILLNSTGKTNEEKIKIFNYNIYQRNYLNEAHAGVAIGVRRNISHRLLDDTTDDVIAVEIDTDRGPIILCTAYIPPRRMIMPYQDISKFMRSNKPAYIIGDLNARHPALGHSRNTMNGIGQALNTCIQRGLLYHLGPNFDTYIQPNRQGRPDIVLGNKNIHHNIAIKQGPLTTSDHIPLEVKITSRPILIKGSKKFNLKKANWNNFKNMLRQSATEFQLENQAQDKEQLDENLTKWHNQMELAMNSTIPQKEFITLPHPKETELQKRLQLQYTMLKNLRERIGWTIQQRQAFLTLQNSLKEECKKNYYESWNKLLQNIELKTNEPKEFWANIKRLMGSTNETTPYLKDETGAKRYKETEKEEIFRKTWSEVFKISEAENRKFCNETEIMVNRFIENNLNRTKPHQLANLDRLSIQDYLTKPVELYNIKLIIKSLKERAPGKSQITKSVLENTPNEMLNILKQIINFAISMGYFPDLYKIAIMNFLGKSGKDLSQAINYRPISLLEVPGKILERIICDRITRYLENNNLLNKDQHGFRKGRGTQTALASLYERIAITQKKKYQCNVVCRDIKKAFDKVWINGLKYKILQLQLPDIIEKLLCSFLTNRKACIKINSTIGPLINIYSGVPQGSILSPILFIYYTADAPRPSPGCFNTMFADDNTQVISYPGKSKQMMARKTETEIKKLNQYERKWKIQTSSEKFQIVSISSTKPTDIIVDGRIIQFKKQAKVLGLNLTTRGIPVHTKERADYARAQLTRLKRFKKLSTKTRLRLYKAFIRPLLEYPAIPLCTISKHGKLKLQRIQNKAVRGAAKERPDQQRSTNESLHRKFKLEPMNIRIHNQAASIWAKLEMLDPDLIRTATELCNHNQYKDHYWWPTIAKCLSQGPPAPLYKAE